jgi:hypothetical protein
VLRAHCAPPLTPLSPFPEPRVAILRERRALGSAEIVSNPHIVKRAGLRDPRRLRRLAGVPLSRCLFRDVPWPLAGSHGSDGGDATSTTIRGRTHAALVTSSCHPARMPAHVPSTAVRRAAPFARRTPELHRANALRRSYRGPVWKGERRSRYSLLGERSFLGEIGEQRSGGDESRGRLALPRGGHEPRLTTPGHPLSPAAETSGHRKNDRRVRRTEILRVRRRCGRLRRTHREPR